ncbi:MAG: S9 family peptidase [Candidatus Omnitrophota bacterium]
MAVKTAHSGSWRSPVTADLAAAGAVKFGHTAVDRGNIYWVETRPSENGRNALMELDTHGKISGLTPETFNVRTRVHEYGGGDFAVSGGVVYFSNFSDQKIYARERNGNIRPLSRTAGMRYADLEVSPSGEKVICVREDHTVPENEAVNTIVCFSPDGGLEEKVLSRGSDFYSSPRVSHDGKYLAWITWDHPNMPWDGTRLWKAEFDARGGLSCVKQIAGGSSESVMQPEWGPDGSLYFISDRTGWWNLYRYINGETEHLIEKNAEFGRPQWVFGMSSYAVGSENRLVCSYAESGEWKIGVLDLAAKTFTVLDAPFTDISQVRAFKGMAVFTGGSPVHPLSLVTLDIETRDYEVLRESAPFGVNKEYLSAPRKIEFPVSHGEKSRAFYYPPVNPEYTLPAGEKPVTIVISHSGPTSAASTVLNPAVQYWTSRGIAVLDVNYGGSTGYGRDYRKRLDGKWGVVDLNDCVAAARYMAETGEADPERLAIRGSSAGGYTTLCALAFSGVFKAGASYYGVSDLELLVKETHKFESKYIEKLVGPYPARSDLYRERSPARHIERITCPVIFFQGLDDKVVPPDQADIMADALKKKGIPVAYMRFEGEQHGFRKAKSVKRSLEAELYFYSRVFGFDLAEHIEPVWIDNLA